MLKAALRNLLLPAFLVGVVVLFCAMIPGALQSDYPAPYQRGMLYLLCIALPVLLLLIVILVRYRLSGGMLGFVVGSVVGGIFAAGGAMMSVMMLAFSSDSGMEGAGQAMSFTIPVSAALMLSPLLLFCFLGALIGNTMTRRRLRAEGLEAAR